MKKIIFAVLLLLTSVSIYSQTSQEWKWIHPKPQGQYINCFDMIDSLNWIGAGNYGSFFKTTNAGVTWQTSTGGYPSTLNPGAPIFVDFRSAWFFNANTGYLGVQSSYGIVKTTNGGITFDTVNLGLSSKVFSYGMYFLNQQTGFVVGSSPLKCARTTNGGINWTVLPNLGTSALYNVHAWDTSNVIVGGSTSGKLFKTSNAGTSWDTINFGTTNTIYEINFINNLTGYVGGTSGLFRFTTNGGLNWSGINPPTTMTIYSIVKSGSDIYAAGSSSVEEMYKSTDNGNTWTTISYANSGQLTGVDPEGFDKIGNTMVIAGTYGIMLKSTNNGVNWTSLTYAKSVASMIDIAAIKNTGRVIAIGYNAGTPDVVLYSSNGGNTFNAGNYKNMNNLSSICMLNSNTGYISGRYGLFAKTTDGGATWDTTYANNPVTSPYFGNGVSFVNENTGWIVGGIPSVGGLTKIFKTTNCGANWAEQTSAYTGPIGVKIDMINANTGYMSGTVIQKTTNGGINWTLTTNPASGSTYTPIKALDSLTVFVGTSNTQAYCTTDGGTTWHSLNFPIAAGTLFGMDFYDYNNGAVGSTTGLVGKTTNHGQTWQIYNTGGYTTYSIKMIHPDTIYTVSGNTFGAQVFKYMKGTVTSGFTYENKIPTEYLLKQNYPNPFNPVTTIEFDIVKAGNVSINVYDISGREYNTEIRNLSLMPGSYKLNFNGTNLSSGIYFYSLNVEGKNVSTKKMILLK